MKHLLGEIRRLDEAFHLIDPGDKIAVGLSGGKDSLALLRLLAQYRTFSPHSFSLCAITIKMGEPFNTNALANFCHSLDIPWTMREAHLENLLQNDKHPCALCARLRRGTLLRLAAEQGCQKLAFAHHRDDLLQTYCMSALSEGRFYVLPPRSEREQTGVSVIRPLLTVKETALAGFAERFALPVQKNPCPVDGLTRRADTGRLLEQLEAIQPGAQDHLFTAIQKLWV